MQINVMFCTPAENEEDPEWPICISTQYLVPDVRPVIIPPTITEFVAISQLIPFPNTVPVAAAPFTGAVPVPYAAAAVAVALPLPVETVEPDTVTNTFPEAGAIKEKAKPAIKVVDVEVVDLVPPDAPVRF